MPNLHSRKHPTGVCAAAILAVVTASASSALAQDPDAGRKLAADWCSVCHTIDRTPEGAAKRAPSFARLAATSAMTPLALRVFLQTPHDRMPNIRLTAEQIDDVVAYIDSLRPPPRRP